MCGCDGGELLLFFVAGAAVGMLRRLAGLVGAFAESVVVDKRRFFTAEAPVCTACRLRQSIENLRYGANGTGLSAGFAGRCG